MKCIDSLLSPVAEYKDLIAFNVGRTLPNTDLSQDFMGLVMNESMDLASGIWHLASGIPRRFFCRGR